MSDNRLLLEARGIGRRARDGEAWLLEDVSLAIGPGDRLGISGPSGSGKTLLMRALALLDPLDAGEVLWRGETIRAEAVPRFRRSVVYLHQRPAMFEGTVRDNLRRPFDLRIHQDLRFDPERAERILESLGRGAAFLEKSAQELSGGEAQVVALARALELDPDVLLLDEATSAMDPGTTRSAEEAVAAWQRGGARAYAWVAHDEEQVARVTERGLRLRHGRLEEG